MKRKDTKLGQKVMLYPKPSKGSPDPAPRPVYIIENHNPRLAGVSSVPNPPNKSCYGVRYSILRPIGLTSAPKTFPSAFVQKITGRKEEYLLKRLDKWRKNKK
jgi:hypothetical protein